ncbi:MAG: PEP-CTERM sorting domain-containing protein [Planctomycetota bacterium]
MASTLHTVLLTTAAGAFVAGTAYGFIDPALSGTTDLDAWDNLTISNPQIDAASPAFPSFPGSTPWPEPIESVLTQGTATTTDDDPTGDATFDKTAGFGYPASISIYSSPFGNGSYAVSDATPVTGLELVFFQIEIGEGSGGFLDGDPTLTVNGSTVVPLFDSGLVDLVTAPNPFLGGAILPIATLGYLWDVSGLGPITEFDVAFTTAGTSTTIIGLQLDQGSEFEAFAIPEPASLALFGLGAALMLPRRRRA